jgi:hypothetical protein
VDRAAAALEGAGVRLEQRPVSDAPSRTRCLLVADPDGNTIQLFSRLRRAAAKRPH